MLTNDTQPPQVIPNSRTGVTVVGFYVAIFPEGVEVSVGVPGASTPTPQLTVALEKGKAELGGMLPVALPQPCCSGGAILNIVLANDQRATYGPCTRPAIVDQIINDLYTALDASHNDLNSAPATSH